MTNVSSTQTVSALSWFNRRGYLQGVFWAVMVCLISSLNDVFTRFTGARLDALEVSFFRFLFSLITLIPVMLYFNKSTFKTKKPIFHSIRAILGYIAITCWVAGVTTNQLAISSIMAQTVAFFVLPMAFLFLREKVGWQRTLATLAGFIGILITIQGSGEFSYELASINMNTVWLIIAAILFAASDILNKIMVADEHPLTMLFYFALGTTALAALPAMYVWQAPEVTELLWLLCLGCGANLILFCLLKAFAATEISALQPYRYVEIIFATTFGFMLFGELPTVMTLIGAAIIIPSTFIIAMYETRQAQNKNAIPDKQNEKAREAA